MNSCVLFYPGGGGGRYNPPRVVTSKINLHKSLWELKEEGSLDKQRLKSQNIFKPIDGFLKKAKTHITLDIQNGYPICELTCHDKNGNLKWTFSSEAPQNSIDSIYFEHGIRESRIYVLRGGKNQLISILNENGQEIKKIYLDKARWLSGMTITEFSNKRYIILHGSYSLKIYSIDGLFIKEIDLPRYPRVHFAKEIQDKEGKLFLVLWCEQQATSHSSTLFMLSPNWSIEYKEYLLGAEWISFPKDNSTGTFIINPEHSWRPDGKWIDIGGPWKYTLK